MAKKTHEEFLKQKEDKGTLNHIDVLSRYDGMHNSMDFYCNIHDEYFTQNPVDLLNSCGCRQCGYDQITKGAKNRFYKYADMFIAKGYKVVTKHEEYINSHSKIKYICPNHPDVIQEMVAADIKYYGCRLCAIDKVAGANKYTFEYVESEFEIRDYDLLETEYHNNKTPMRYRCRKHPNCIQTVTLNHLLSHNSGCYMCSESSGEHKARLFFDKYNIEYIPQKTFEGCKYKNLLRFDFYLNDYNILIEIQGEYHFIPIQFCGISTEKANENFGNQLIRDKIKREYCKKNNIDLLEIPHFLFDEIEDILDNYLQGLEEMRKEMVI